MPIPERIDPDYRGGGIVNLMSSIVRSRGGHSDHPESRILPADELTRVTNLVLLVVDGLGADWLARRSPDGILNQSLRGSLTSVFPATTAAAITTFLTGEAPLQHGLTGWFTYLRELGCVMTVLPGNPRYGGVSYRQAGVDPMGLFGHTSVFDRIRSRGICVSPHFIAHSDFNRSHAGSAEILPYRDLSDMFRQAARALRTKPRWGRRAPPESTYCYLYWPRLDGIGHEMGMESPAAAEHLIQLEQALESFLEAIKGTDTLVLVTADHGHVDTTPADVLDLIAHPELEDALLLPLCGEPRAAFCYLRNGREADFVRYCEERLGDRIDLIPSRQLVEEGLFGIGKPHPRFMDRIGDYCILPRDRGVILQRLPTERPHPQIGVHGGLSSSELMVPLCLFRP
ncbi:alkaline phosphatase family protein [Imhoffiella purpurea]|uniref:Alkaline phosphodiesterase I n=1 Tax=Imhoffiella purpurea TaxID=1249627 RepID=W9W2J9_9GAMM|nr:alkaline phosphatase family protein [Imhoffiella purpurea]EXJ16795.1 Alkaline phosphodiesterase I [Imhoffiella purpurea]